MSVFSRLLLLLAATISLSAAAHDLLTNVPNRKTVSLNGAWHSIVDPYETGYYNYRGEAYDRQPEASKSAYYADYHARDKSELVEYDFDRSPVLMVPGDWNSQRESLFFYEGTVWYKRSFDFTFAAPGNRLFVYFGAVNYEAEVYLNGVKLGMHEGGFTPFNFEISRLVKPRDNVLVVKVNNTRRKENVPTLSTDWWNYGGITRDVLLIEEPAAFIENFSVRLRKGSTNTLQGSVDLNGVQRPETVTVEIPELGVRRTLQTDSHGHGSFEFATAGIVLWSPQAPKLYTVRVATATQTLRDEIGFRAIETRGSDILLNGKPLFLRGISIHEENPLRGARAYSEDDAHLLLNWAKELGCNYVRLAHYPHNEHMLRMADRMGLLVWEEIPVYWTVDFANPDTLAKARNQLTEMIVRDRNRAAVAIWSMANETPPGEARNAFLLQLIDHARALDPTRLISAALETHAERDMTVVSDSIGAHLDIIAFNQYRGWYGGTLHDAPDAKWDVRFDKPVVISEFGGDAKQGMHGLRDERWTEEYQEYLYQQNLAMIMNIPNVRGMSPWILADFRSPRRLLPGIQDGYNRKGLISNEGNRKKAFFVLRGFYRALSDRHE